VSLCKWPLSDDHHSAPRLPNHQDVATQHLVLGSEAYVRENGASRNIVVIIALQ
jgi:hypothetical protein